MLVQMLAESLARRISDTVEHEVQRLLRGTDGAHAVVDTTRADPMLVSLNILDRLEHTQDVLG